MIDPHKMKMHDLENICGDCTILRVPGGWIYTMSGKTTECTFVQEDDDTYRDQQLVLGDIIRGYTYEGSVNDEPHDDIFKAGWDAARTGVLCLLLQNGLVSAEDGETVDD